MVNRDVLIDVKPEQIRVAVLEDGELVSLELSGHAIGAKEMAALVGNIYSAKVEKVLPGMQSAFIDIGLEQNAYIHVRDVVPVQFDNNGNPQHGKELLPAIESLLKPGQNIVVQVIRESTGDKGPRVCTRLSLTGQYCLIMPNSDVVGVSNKIEDASERFRLQSMALQLKTDHIGLILRTASETAEFEGLEKEYRSLLNEWERISLSSEKGPVPRLLRGQPEFLEKLVRDHLKADTGKLITNDLDTFEKLQNDLSEKAPSLKKKLQWYNKEYDMFAFYSVEQEIRRALSREVWLKSGGYLVFDYTEAMTVVDVNSGKYTGKKNTEETFLKTNLEAAAMIARQVRLRSLGGIILIDFIDMKSGTSREKLISTLKEAFKADLGRTIVLGMTQLGLVEITRKKDQIPLYKRMDAVCPLCRGTGLKKQPTTC
jgi:ribonuclease G